MSGDHDLNISRFMRKTLMPGEKVIKDARFHGFYTFSACFVLAVCVVFGGGLQYLFWHYTGQWEMMPLYICAGVGVWLWYWMMLKKWTTEILLTDHRILYKRGFFLVNIDEVDIEQLASDYVQQTLLGRMLDYGSIHIRCVEASDIWLPPIARPYEFRNAVEKMKHVFREKYMDVNRLYKHGSRPHDGHEA